jgi:hypothetical protein
MGVEHGGHELDLAVRIPVEQGDPRGRLGRLGWLAIGEQPRDDVLHGPPRGGQVGAPGHAAVIEVDPLQEAGDDLAELAQHEVGVGPRLRQRVRAHPEQEGLVPLARAVDAHVGQRGGGQHASHGIEGLGPDGLAVHEVGVGLVLRELVPVEVGHQRDELGVGVEEPVHVADVAQAQPGPQHLRVPVVAVAAAQAGVVGDVPGRLLQVGHEPAPLEDLGQQVGGLLAGQVHPAELGHRVVAVLEEHPVVELLGPPQADGGVDGLVALDVEVADELVEEQPPQALR